MMTPRTGLDDFLRCCHPANRHERKEAGRFKAFGYDELIKRDRRRFYILPSTA